MTMPNKAVAKQKEGFARKQKDAFLAKLAETSNVTAAAKVAGIARARVYDERLKSAAFRDAWHLALCEGYVRLETELLGESLRPASGTIKDTTLKARQMKIRLGQMLLAQHKASVRGDAPKPSARPAMPRDAKSVRARLEARFAQMRERMADEGE